MEALREEGGREDDVDRCRLRGLNVEVMGSRARIGRINGLNEFENSFK